MVRRREEERVKWWGERGGEGEVVGREDGGGEGKVVGREDS